MEVDFWGLNVLHVEVAGAACPLAEAVSVVVKGSWRVNTYFTIVLSRVTLNFHNKSRGFWGFVGKKLSLCTVTTVETFDLDKCYVYLLLPFCPSPSAKHVTYVYRIVTKRP